MVTQKVHTLVTAVMPYLSAAILALFSIVGFFILEKFDSIAGLQVAVSELRTEQEVMKGNRFTSANGLEVWQEIGKIRSELLRIEAIIPERGPERWFEERVDRLSNEVQGLSSKMQEVLAQTNKNAALIASLKTNGDKPFGGP